MCLNKLSCDAIKPAEQQDMFGSKSVIVLKERILGLESSFINFLSHSPFAFRDFGFIPI